MTVRNWPTPQIFHEGIHLRVGNWGELLETPLPAAAGAGLDRHPRPSSTTPMSWQNGFTKPFLFLGMIGSKRKWRMIGESFLKRKIATAEQLARVASPVGLDIGAASVQEIAVSILAQYVQKRAQHTGRKF